MEVSGGLRRGKREGRGKFGEEEKERGGERQNETNGCVSVSVVGSGGW